MSDLTNSNPRSYPSRLLLDMPGTWEDKIKNIDNGGGQSRESKNYRKDSNSHSRNNSNNHNHNNNKPHGVKKFINKQSKKEQRTQFHKNQKDDKKSSHYQQSYHNNNYSHNNSGNNRSSNNNKQYHNKHNHHKNRQNSHKHQSSRKYNHSRESSPRDFDVPIKVEVDSKIEEGTYNNSYSYSYNSNSNNSISSYYKSGDNSSERRDASHIRSILSQPGTFSEPVKVNVTQSHGMDFEEDRYSPRNSMVNTENSTPRMHSYNDNQNSRVSHSHQSQNYYHGPSQHTSYQHQQPQQEPQVKLQEMLQDQQQVKLEEPFNTYTHTSVNMIDSQRNQQPQQLAFDSYHGVNKPILGTNSGSPDEGRMTSTEFVLQENLARQKSYISSNDSVKLPKITTDIPFLYDNKTFFIDPTCFHFEIGGC